MPLPEITEEQFQNQILAYVRARGLLAYHTYNSRRSVPGWPDLAIVGARGVLFRELKREKGKVSPDQQFWISALGDAGQDVGVWRPSDWPHRVCKEIDALGKVTAERPLPSQDQLRRQLQRRASRGAKKDPDLT